MKTEPTLETKKMAKHDDFSPIRDTKHDDASLFVGKAETKNNITQATPRRDNLPLSPRPLNLRYPLGSPAPKNTAFFVIPSSPLLRMLAFSFHTVAHGQSLWSSRKEEPNSTGLTSLPPPAPAYSACEFTFWNRFVRCTYIIPLLKYKMKFKKRWKNDRTGANARQKKKGLPARHRLRQVVETPFSVGPSVGALVVRSLSPGHV